MRSNRLYSLSEFMNKTANKPYDRRIAISGDIADLYNVQYNVIKSFPNDEVTAKHEDNCLVILYANYLDKRIETFVEKYIKDKLTIIDEQ